MKIKLIHKQRHSQSGFIFTNLTHIKVLNNGKFVASKQEIEAPQELLKWGEK